MASQITQAEEAAPAGYPFAVDPHPAAPVPLTAADLEKMQAEGRYDDLADALASGAYVPPPLPPRTDPPVAPMPVASEAEAPAIDVPQASVDPWYPSIEQRTQDVCSLADAAAICSGVDPVRLRQAQMERELIRVSDDEIDRLQAIVTSARKCLENDGVFEHILDDPRRVLDIEKKALAEFRRARPNVRPNPAEFRRFRYAQAVGLRAAASQLLLHGLPVAPGIISASDDMGGLPGSDYVERPSQFTVYAGIDDIEREQLAAPNVRTTLAEAVVFALGGSSMRRAEVRAELTGAQLAPPLQPERREHIAQLQTQATTDESLIAEGIDAAIEMAPQWWPGLLAVEDRITREGRAQNSLARNLTSPDRRGPEFSYDIRNRAHRVLDANMLRAFFCHVAPVTGWAPPQLGEAQSGQSKFNASPALELWMRMGANPTDFAAAAGGIR